VRAPALIGVLLLLTGAALAQRADPAAESVARAKTHFEAGRALYNLGNYSDAIREFSAGYALVPRPQFLLNLGQAYRRQDDLPHAREMFKRFLADAPARDPDRRQAQLILDEIEDTLLEQPRQPAPPERRIADPYVGIGPSPTPAAVSLVASPLPPEKPRKSFMARHWWIIPVSAVLVAGASVGLYYAIKPADPVGCEQASLGCLEVMTR